MVERHNRTRSIFANIIKRGTCIQQKATRACSGVNRRLIMLLSSSNSSASSSTFSCCQCKSKLRKQSFRIERHNINPSHQPMHALRTRRVLEHQIHRLESRHAGDVQRLQVLQLEGRCGVKSRCFSAMLEPDLLIGNMKANMRGVDGRSWHLPVSHRSWAGDSDCDDAR